jgi:hypothetical protein
MTKSTAQFGAAVVLACAALALTSSLAGTTTTVFPGAATGCMNLTPDGRTDSQLPAAGEPRSLTDPSISTPALPTGHQLLGAQAPTVSRHRSALRMSQMTG